MLLIKDDIIFSLRTLTLFDEYSLTISNLERLDLIKLDMKKVVSSLEIDILELFKAYLIFKDSISGLPITDIAFGKTVTYKEAKMDEGRLYLTELGNALLDVALSAAER
ncbi:hypothetical protein HBP98_00725 [Listeria booriae]|uniref:Uncharacterized protein n=1 Tax=Listeria booriae TaxID=1552123 RepID=A0A7X1A3C0_9LIST|nr:hypothetical protein [Listeria booriae]MBC2370516.1 hypothetical protein [Listeria booriae]